MVYHNYPAHANTKINLQRSLKKSLYLCPNAAKAYLANTKI